MTINNLNTILSPMTMSNIYIIGHRNPDTDSIASAYAYAELKKLTDKDNSYTAARCGNANNQTKYIFQRADVNLPPLVKNVYPKVGDVMTRNVLSVNEQEPVLNLFHKMDEADLQFLPVTDSGGKLRGVVSSAELLHLFVQEDVDQRPKYLFQAESIPGVIKGKTLHKGGKASFTAALMIGAMSMERSSERIEFAGAAETLLVVGNRKDLIEYAVGRDIPAIIITGTKDESEIGVDFSAYRGWVFLSSLDSAETVRRVILATPTGTIMNSDAPVLTPDDYVETAQDLIVSSKHRSISIVEDEKLVGILTRTDLLKKYRHKLILVDHNEADQAVEGIETAEVLEIIDHHRLGAVKTTAPVTFYAKPVGSTCTLVYQLYRNYGIKPDKSVAMLLMGGIISDTVMLKSPTVTEDDRIALKELEALSGVDAAQYGLDIFSATDSLTARTPENIVMTDFKMYSEYGINMGIGQVEVVTLADLDEMSAPILDELEKQRRLNKLDWAMLLVTDIIMETSILLTTPFPLGEKLLSYAKLSDSAYSLPGILSRKKQLLPEILRIAEELS